MNCDANNTPGKLQITPDKVEGHDYLYHLFWGQNNKFDNVCILFQIYDFTAEDLQDLGEIGRGNFGSVNKMLHIKSNTVMAVKVSRKI